MSAHSDAEFAELERIVAELTRTQAERDAENSVLIARQEASVEVLRAISTSPGDTQPVFELIVRHARNLCDAQTSGVTEYDGSLMYSRVIEGLDPEATELLWRSFPRPAGTESVAGRVVLSGQTIHVRDTHAETDYFQTGRTLGTRSMLGVPLLRDKRVVGTIILGRFNPGGFDDSEIALVESFADQAVIAMENARLVTEQREALEQQTATAEVLAIINRSPGDLAPVFTAIMERSLRLCDAAFGLLGLFEDGHKSYRAVAMHNVPDAMAELFRDKRRVPPDSSFGRVARGESPIHVNDAAADQVGLAASPMRRAAVEIAGVHTTLWVALRNDREVLGTIVAWRREVRPFTAQQIALLEGFAAQAVIAIENARLLGELQDRTADLQESLEYQTATSDVLKVISRSTFDLQPVLDTVVETAMRLCNADLAQIFNRDGEVFRGVAVRSSSPEFAADVLGRVITPGKGGAADRALLEKQTIHIEDVTNYPNYSATWAISTGQIRSVLGVPLLRDGIVLGVIGVGRTRVQPFTDREIELVRVFADQAVIAIENTRLLTEQREALEQQTATAEVLQVINGSPGNLAPVFDALLEKALHLCGGAFGLLYTFDGQRWHDGAARGLPKAYAAYKAVNPTSAGPLQQSGSVRQLMETMRPVHILDMREDAAYQSGSAGSRSFVDLGGARTTVRVPLVKDGTLLGAIAIYRQEVNAFTDKQIALLESFAAQAVIAMENARLLGELRERTEELARRNSAFAERIDHQAATIEVLKEMSDSPSDAQPVFDLICRQAKALLGAPVVALFEYDGNLVHLRVNPGIEDVVDRGLYATYQNAFPMVPDRGSLSCRAIVDGTILHIRDLGTEPGISEMVRALGHKTQVTIPLMRDGHAIGAISAASMKVDAISDTQIELLKTFAEQAVIAIGSAETYRALQERTAALAQRNSEFGERIEQQAATIDVLKVMSSTPDDTQPVFDQIVLRARELCNVPSAALFQFDGELVHYRARALPDGVNSDEFVLYHKLFPMAPDPGSLTCRAILEKRVIHVRNAETEPGISAAVRGVIRRTGLLSQLSVPMLRDGLALGAITLNSSNTSGFTDSQIALLQTFAEQAVIAIGSVSTFRALRERTAELTRSVAELQALEEVLRAVNSSLDLDTVLETIISRAVTLSQADEGTIYEYDDNDEVFVLKATHGMTETRVARLREARIKLGDTYLGRAGLRREPVHVSDLQLDPTMPDITKEALHDIHAVLAVPLLRDDKVLGGLVIRRRTTGDFQATIPNLLQTFAAQSVLAIENARLFQDARRARLAAEATLTDLRRTQDRLVQTEKMASLGQLTAGIAHEIKNPLNFVNNFSDLSVDLLNELNEAVAPDRLAVADDLRAEIDEITATLKGNLERIAQHGRRADSIVKNMLLHSRTGPSEHREIDLNATVEEALNLAYHGARAEMPGFNITLERHFDPAAGVIDAFPQEFTRVMLNLMSNGFYAARKRLATAPQGFEPTLTVTTTNLGEWVKIQVRDNGTGMPDTVRDKIFEPFFTTKPAGEGTGLGLSLSFDIVVKQHGGQLTVDSAVDTFTEFTVTLPRRVAAGAG